MQLFESYYFFLLEWCAFIEESTISLLDIALEENQVSDTFRDLSNF